MPAGLGQTKGAKASVSVDETGGAAPSPACPVSGQPGGVEDCPFAKPKKKASPRKKAAGAGAADAAPAAVAPGDARPSRPSEGRATGAGRETAGGGGAEAAKPRAKSARPKPKDEALACPAVRMVNKVSYLQRIQEDASGCHKSVKTLPSL